ncbi:MAG: helix-turn-helix domain-containing protein [Chitinivibrionales bacterium]|nr:helix-turn-helix domain-containing protein [Chitinivibrionales bacterium]MBD3396149.1 helix-turn-helix domain-containing protein [Chitinivibrionales bacterium]
MRRAVLCGSFRPTKKYSSFSRPSGSPISFILSQARMPCRPRSVVLSPSRHESAKKTQASPSQGPARAGEYPPGTRHQQGIFYCVARGDTLYLLHACTKQKEGSQSGDVELAYKRIPQTELAKRAGVTQSVIARMESSSARPLPRINILKRIVNAMGYETIITAKKGSPLSYWESLVFVTLLLARG